MMCCTESITISLALSLNFCNRCVTTIFSSSTKPITTVHRFVEEQNDRTNKNESQNCGIYPLFGRKRCDELVGRTGDRSIVVPFSSNRSKRTLHRDAVPRPARHGATQRNATRRDAKNPCTFLVWTASVSIPGPGAEPCPQNYQHREQHGRIRL